MQFKLIVVICFLAGVLESTVAQTTATANFCIGLNVDGNGDEWEHCGSPEITMSAIQVGLPDSGVLPGNIRARFAHDTTNMYVLVSIDGDYHLNLTAGNTYAHSMSVMWKVGEDATMRDMGGCVINAPQAVSNYDCAAVQTYCANNASECSGCRSHMVDVWHIESGNPGSIPGVQYPYRGPLVFPLPDGTYSSLGYEPNGDGAYQPSVERLFNGNDHTSNTDDEFSVHPCLRADDGSSSAHLTNFRINSVRYGNELVYAWSHSAIDSYKYPFAETGASGYYTYEFSRPLSTNENTDAQFSLGGEASFAFAFWIPPAAGVPWGDSNHYVAPAELSFGTLTLSPSPFTSGGGEELRLSLYSGLLVAAMFLSAVYY